MKIIQWFFLLTLLSLHQLNPAIIEHTLVLTPSGHIPIENLTISEILVCGQGQLAAVTHIKTYTTENSYIIKTDTASLHVSHDQLLFDAHSQKWILTSEINENSSLIDINNTHLPFHIQKCADPVTAYEISLEYPHTFYISESNILAHNVLFVLAPVASVIIPIIKTCVAATVVGIIAHTVNQKTKNAPTHSYKNQHNPQPTTPKQPKKDEDRDDEDDDDSQLKVANMHEFFQTKFGKEIHQCLQKTSTMYQGQSVYKVKWNMPQYNLRKGDLLYLDALHKNHLEIFNSTKQGKMVLSLRGKMLHKKTDIIKRRILR